MSIPDTFKTNFQTLLQAADAGHLCLLECKDAQTGADRYVICAVWWDGDVYQMTPFGHMAEGNPFETYLPPDPEVTA